MESDADEEDKRGQSMDEYGEHVRQNNLRLVTLTQCIAKEVTFASACNELHNWCKDPRAFTSNFEENLLEALQAAFSVCTQDGFDLQLVSDLINTCFHARRSLSNEGATRVARWYEQLRRKRASRAAKLKRKEERERRLVEESNRINYDLSLHLSSSFIDHLALVPSEEGLHPPSIHLSMWNQSGITGAGPSTPASSVPMQSPAFANHFGHMSPSFNQQRMMMGSSPTGVPGMPPGGMYAPMMGFPSGMAPSGGMMVQAPAAVAAAAVAAAPTKKQTAAQVQQQQQLQMRMMQQQQQQAAQAQQAPLHLLHPSAMPMGGMLRVFLNEQRQAHFQFMNGIVSPQHPVYQQLYTHFVNQQRMMQHHHHQQQQAMAAAAGGGGGGGGGGGNSSSASLTSPSPHFGQQPAMNAQGVPIATQTAPGQVRPLNGYAPTPSLPSLPSLPMGMIPSMMTPGGSHPMASPSPNITGGPPGSAAPQVQRVGTPVAFGQLQQQAMQHQVLCVPNPMICNDTILRIEKYLMPAIEMIHDEKIRKTPFTISTEELMRLSDHRLEVHIQSWSRNDKLSKIVWHKRDEGYVCEIRLNGETMHITHPDKSIVVDKRLLKDGDNELEIVEKSCVCLASFGMAIVERIPTREAINRIFNLPANNDAGKDALDRNKAKMRELISRESPIGQIRLPLFCLKTRSPLRTPARSIKCIHSSCFDLEPTLKSGMENGIYECPICQETFQLPDIEVDHFVGSILKETYKTVPQPLEVMLDQSCTWRMIPRDESLSRFAPSLPHPSYSAPYVMHPSMQHMQHMGQSMQHLHQQQQQQHAHSMSFPSSFPAGPSMMQQQQHMPLQQLQPTQMNGGRKRESSGTETGGTALKRFKSESFVTAPSGRSPAPMIAPQSVAPSMMMMGGPTTPMGGMYGGGPPSVPAMHQSMSSMTSPYTGVVHPSPMKDPSSHHSHVAASPMGSAMAPSTPYGSAGMGGMNGMSQTALTCAIDGGGHVQPTSSAPYTPGSVDNKSNGMTTVTASVSGPLSHPHQRAPSAALTPDTLASTSNASAEDEGPLRDSLSNIDGLFLMGREMNLQEYLYIVGSLEAAKLDDFDIYNFDTPPASLPSLPPPQTNEAWNDALSVCGVPSSA